MSGGGSPLSAGEHGVRCRSPAGTRTRSRDSPRTWRPRPDPSGSASGSRAIARDRPETAAAATTSVIGSVDHGEQLESVPAELHGQRPLLSPDHLAAEVVAQRRDPVRRRDPHPAGLDAEVAHVSPRPACHPRWCAAPRTPAGAGRWAARECRRLRAPSLVPATRNAIIRLKNRYGECGSASWRCISGRSSCPQQTQSSERSGVSGLVGKAMVLANAHTWSGSAALKATRRRNICSFQGRLLPPYLCGGCSRCWWTCGRRGNVTTCARSSRSRSQARADRRADSRAGRVRSTGRRPTRGCRYAC